MSSDKDIQAPSLRARRAAQIVNTVAILKRRGAQIFCRRNFHLQTRAQAERENVLSEQPPGVVERYGAEYKHEHGEAEYCGGWPTHDAITPDQRNAFPTSCHTASHE
jgi:hypothetical protein